MTWVLYEPEANAATIVKEFIDTFYIPKTFNVEALTSRIADAIRQAEEAAREEGRKEAAEYVAGYGDTTKHNKRVARVLEDGIRALT